jgi:hypothetical protein
MLLVVEVIVDFKYVLLINISIEINVFQELDLIDTLIEVVLVVFYDLNIRAKK